MLANESRKEKCGERGVEVNGDPALARVVALTLARPRSLSLRRRDSVGSSCREIKWAGRTCS